MVYSVNGFFFVCVSSVFELSAFRSFCLGTIHLRFRHCLRGVGGRGQIFAKFADGRGLGVKMFEKFADVLGAIHKLPLQKEGVE